MTNGTPRRVGHMMILASAGTGKTHALTTRFIRLLALGAAPERIVALTFTRKAAGEFFDRILHRLATAATSAGAAAELAAAIDEPGLGLRDFRRVLRATVEAMPRLRLGTLDGFFARIARNFPLELGLTGEFELLEGHGIQRERERVLRQLFAGRPTASGGPPSAMRDFIEAFKLATFGADEKRLGAKLDGFLDQHHEIFLGAAAREFWGDPGRIWPRGCEFLPEPRERVAESARALAASLVGVALTPDQERFWREFFEGLEGWEPGAPQAERVKNILGNALKAWPALGEVMVAKKKLALPEGARRALRGVVVAIIGAEYDRHLKITRGVHAVLAGFEAGYHDSVRRAGKLTFADVQRLLEPLRPAQGAPERGAASTPPSGGRLLSREEGSDRLFIDYRLDAEIDHWLLDEFQDTSFGQWSILRNLIDEAVQDPAGTRSFFYVGDVKQAIFTWRGGDPVLFDEIFAHYNGPEGGTIEKAELNESWRSGPPIIELVNTVFGGAAAIAGLFPGDASRRWNEKWQKHATVRTSLGGYAAVRHGADRPARWAIVLEHLQQIEPLERGLTCAILVQKNSEAAELADYLRREGGLPALADSEINPCADNPVGAVLLALVKAAAHPGDSLARTHVAMTPLAALLRKQGIVTEDDLTRRILGQIHAGGFEETMAGWTRELEGVLPADDLFSRERCRQFVAAAAQFDATGSRDAAEFAAFMAANRQREGEGGAVIRVMTIHKAKGLDFDVVFLPELEGTKLDGRREGPGVERGPDRGVRWVLDLPPKVLAQADPVLAAHWRAAEAENCYEQLSLLYVAMTRAKRALYVVIKPPAPKSTSRNYPKLLSETLGSDETAVGDPEWFREIDPVEAAPAAIRAIPAYVPGGPPRSARLTARRPSDFQVGRTLDATALLVSRGSAAADRGSTVHALLAEIRWGGAADFASLLSTWGERGMATSILDLLRRFLRSPAALEIWQKPADPALFDVWNERAFEVVLGETWVSGAFDRVAIERDAGDKPITAMIYDFKTDRVRPGEGKEAAAGYAGQLDAYRRAVQRLTGLPADRIRCFLVFLENGELMET